jgi:succinate-semialdehyde dehydrogenase/glutarate-semialdehyde dehydrogenase
MTTTESAPGTALRGQLLIDGAWTDAADGATLEVLDPSTGQAFGTVPVATGGDLEAALAAAARAGAGWRTADPWARSAVLRRAARIVGDRTEDLARTLSTEQGKPIAEARAELNGAAEIIDWCADEARRVYGRTIPARSDGTRLLVSRSAVGPVAAFTASNFPALLPARKLGAALAAGCAVVLKPAEEAPFTALALGAAFQEAGLPAGVLNIVTGDPAAIAARLIASPVIRKISLTGSVPVGRELLRLAADRVLATSMELGGHAAGLVFPDADLPAVADTIVAGKWRNCGQVCIALSRLLVHRDVAELFTALLVQRMAGLRLGPGHDPRTQVGPLISARSRDRVESLLADAVSRGAVVRAGGGRPDGRADLTAGFYFQPTLLTDVPETARIWREEPFGPVLPVRTFADVDEGLALANATDFGLSGYVFTRDLATALRVSDGLEAGMVGVNSLVIATAEAPAGGVKQSGFGREGGSESLADYTVTKYVNLKL